MKRVWFSICKNPLLHTIFNFQKQVHIYWYCRLHCVYTVHILTANISSDVICRPTALKGRSACWRKRKKYHPLIVVSLKKAMQFLVMCTKAGHATRVNNYFHLVIACQCFWPGFFCVCCFWTLFKSKFMIPRTYFNYKTNQLIAYMQSSSNRNV